MEVTKHLLFNLSLVIILLFVCLVWVERFVALRVYQITAAVYFITSLLLSFVFTYKLNSNMYVDLRIVPVMLGGLYIGIGPVLAILVIVLHGLFGLGGGFIENLVFYATLGILLWCISPWFLRQQAKSRTLYAGVLTTSICIVHLIFLEIINSATFGVDVWLAIIVVPVLGVSMIAHFIEFIDKNLLIREHLIKSKKLEAVEQMGAAISHEIRNPLTAAMGFVQLLQEEPIQSANQTNYLSIIKGELESAERVIQDYLTFSKPELISVEQIQVDEELFHILNLLQPLSNRYSVEVSTEFSAIGLIQGTRQKFHQCFLNIFKNAIEAMPSGGTLSIKTVSTRTHIIIQIKDTGVGMTKKQIERLGEPYYSTKEMSGTGLGMMVVYSIVRAMKGTIEVESEVGKGTFFLITFPSVSLLNIAREINPEK